MLTSEQQQMLLGNLDRERVSTRKGGSGRALSYVEAWDIKRFLIRVFGFGGFSAEVTDNAFRYETMTKRNVRERDRDGNQIEVEKEMWEVAYQATVRLSIPSLGCVYTESAVGSAMGSRAEAHDNAIKNAASDALKRCAIFLGTQFGLSLYKDGSIQDVVGNTLVGPDTRKILSAEDAQFWVEQFTAAETKDDLKKAWMQCMRTGLENVPYRHDGRTLLDDVNDRLSDFQES